MGIPINLLRGMFIKRERERERKYGTFRIKYTQHDLLYSPKERNSVVISCCWKQSSVYSFIYLTFGRLFLRLAPALYISNFTSPWLCTNVWDQTPEDTPVMTWELASCSVSQTELGASMQWAKRIFGSHPYYRMACSTLTASGSKCHPQKNLLWNWNQMYSQLDVPLARPPPHRPAIAYNYANTPTVEVGEVGMERENSFNQLWLNISYF